MTPHPAPLRYRPPQQVDRRALVMAAAAATVGSFEIVAATGLELPRFVLQAGLILLSVAAVLGVRTLVRHRSRRWTITVDQRGVRVLRRTAWTVHPWDTLNAAQVRSGRLELWDTRGRRIELLALGAGHAGDGPEALARAIQDSIDERASAGHAAARATDHQLGVVDVELRSRVAVEDE